jgi:hypothetical protein
MPSQPSAQTCLNGTQQRERNWNGRSLAEYPAFESTMLLGRDGEHMRLQFLEQLAAAHWRGGFDCNMLLAVV